MRMPIAAMLLCTTMAAACAQHKTEICVWQNYEVTALENYFTSYAVCGFPSSDQDRDAIVQGYALINQCSIDDARTALENSSSLIGRQLRGSSALRHVRPA